MRNVFSFLTFLILLFAFSVKVEAYDYDFMFEGVAFKITSSDWNTVELVKGNMIKPDISYPEIEHNGKVYRVTSIGNYAFQGFKSMKAYTVTKWVTTIGEFAFAGCSNLSSVYFEEGSELKIIKANAFNYCTSLTTIIFPEGLEEIGYAAFAHCGFSEVTFPESLKVLGDYSFSSCPSLSWAPISKNVERIGLAPFFDDPEMKYISHNIYNPNYETLPDGSLFEIKTKTLVEYPCGADKTSYVIPDKVERIASASFYGCKKLEKLTLPPSVRQIGDNLTFYWMDSLKEVTTYAKEPFTAAVVGNAKDIKLVVPFGASERYGLGWGEIEEMEPLVLTVSLNGTKQISQIADFSQVFTLMIGREEELGNFVLTFNGEDVTSQVTEKRLYTTPPIVKASTLDITFDGGGNIADVNGDGTVDVADIATVIGVMAANARGWQ